MKIHYSKALGASFALALLGLSASAQTGIGTGSTAPRTMLDVNGAISVTESGLDVTSNSATVPSGFSFVKLTGTPTGAITLTAAAGAVAGQLLTIFNSTGQNATFGTQTILNGQALNMVFSSSTFQATTNGSNALTASNGLTRTGSNFTLGGTLTGAATIGLSGNTLKFAGSSSSTSILPVGNLITASSGTSNITLDLTSSGTDPLLSFKSPNSGNFARIGSAGSTLAFVTGGTNANQGGDAGATPNMVITSAGNVGIGNTAPTTTLTVSGSIASAYLGTSTSATLTAANSVVRNTSGVAGTVTITLDAPATSVGRRVSIFAPNQGASLTAIAAPSGSTIVMPGYRTTNGIIVNPPIAYLIPGQSMELVCDGSNWSVLNYQSDIYIAVNALQGNTISFYNFTALSAIPNTGSGNVAYARVELSGNFCGNGPDTFAIGYDPSSGANGTFAGLGSKEGLDVTDRPLATTPTPNANTSFTFAGNACAIQYTFTINSGKIMSVSSPSNGIPAASIRITGIRYSF